MPTPRRPISNPATVLHPNPKKTACHDRVVPKPTKSRLANMTSVYVTARTAVTDRPTEVMLKVLRIVSLLLVSIEQTRETAQDG
jgi:hypothetical protein